MKSFLHLNILPPTLLLALSALFSRVLGIIRDHLLAKTFGATAGTGIYDLDVYYAAFRIPDMIYSLLVLGVDASRPGEASRALPKALRPLVCFCRAQLR